MSQQHAYIANKASKLPLAIYLMMFEGDLVVYKGTPLHLKTVQLRGGEGTIKKVQVGDYIYLEQNPNTSSKYASMARNGKKILWIIHEPSGKYVGRVVNGEVTKL